MSSQFAPGELRSILLAWTVLSIAISIGEIEGLFTGAGNVDVIAASFIATATAFIFHEMGHKFVAIRLGYVAHFQVWLWGIALTLLTAVVFQGRFLFGAPGAVYISPIVGAGYFGYESRRSNPDRDNMLISAAGPGVNLAFALFFLALLLVAPNSGFLPLVATYGFSLNVGLGSFNMLPIPPIDGYKIFKSNILVALLIALPLWGMFLYFFFLG
jgi:Zn-dependent protease